MLIGYKVFAGNTHDSQTVEQIVTSMGAKYGRASRVWVSGDVVLPTKTADGRMDKRIRLRCVVSPDEAQKALLNRLGLTLP